MKNAAAVIVAVALSSAAYAGVIGHREHDNGSSRSASVEVPLAPVLGRALIRTGQPEAQVLRPCAAGWPVSPIFDRAQALVWVSQQVRAACVVSAAETALANALTKHAWSSPEALQQAADKGAAALPWSRLRAACRAPDPSSITPISGDDVKAQMGGIAYSCNAEGVTIARDGAVFFGGGVIDGKQYKVSLDQSSHDKSSVGGAFLIP